MLETLMIKEIFMPFLIIFASVLIYALLRMIIKRVFRLKIQRVNERKQKALVGLICVVLKVFLGVTALVMILDIYGIDTRSLVTSLGVASLVIGLALQDMIRDFIVGFTILMEDHYSIGDVITINGFTGTVIFIGLKSTRIRAFTGEVKIIANRTIVEVSNHSLELAKITVDVSVTQDSDVNKVRDILDIVCCELTDELSLPEKAQCVGVESIADVGIQFRIVIPAKFSDKMAHARTFRGRIKEALDRENIRIAQPQTVIRSGV